MKQTDKLLRNIIKLDPVDFMGLARILKVNLMTTVKDENEKGKVTMKPRDFIDILQDVLAAFEASNRQRRREILQIVEAAAKHNKEVSVDASDSEDS